MARAVTTTTTTTTIVIIDTTVATLIQTAVTARGTWAMTTETLRRTVGVMRYLRQGITTVANGMTTIGTTGSHLQITAVTMHDTSITARVLCGGGRMTTTGTIEPRPQTTAVMADTITARALFVGRTEDDFEDHREHFPDNTGHAGYDYGSRALQRTTDDFEEEHDRDQRPYTDDYRNHREPLSYEQGDSQRTHEDVGDDDDDDDKSITELIAQLRREHLEPVKRRYERYLEYEAESSRIFAGADQLAAPSEAPQQPEQCAPSENKEDNYPPPPSGQVKPQMLKPRRLYDSLKTGCPPGLPHGMGVCKWYNLKPGYCMVPDCPNRHEFSDAELDAHAKKYGEAGEQFSNHIRGMRSYRISREGSGVAGGKE
ncbi:uncharacterized protein BKCO1_710003 [Diplodia corticola]|uniref:Uncharacterized protein n=1 Tax=Diplodia corticola TaxID=236234 RepID=A0A1J9QP67_9PEZI|nr:uncharacterized protein BKCO1_710003 [Diplodia corticola]OJD29842.1 hypothetical protein BKCO1_710003 [Diplodia corticola]